MLAENDDGGEGGNARIEYEALAGKTYIAKVRPYDRDETGAYRIRARKETPPPDLYEPNDTMEEAIEIPLNEPVESYFHRDAVDWYRVEIPARGPLSIYTESSLDTRLTIYDAGGNELDSDDDSGSKYNARLHITAPPGTLYIEVSEYDGERGVYTLHVKTE